MKLILEKLLFIAVLLLCLSLTFAACNIKLKNKKLFFEADNENYSEFNFVVSRHYDNDNVYRDYGILCIDSLSENCSIKIMLNDNSIMVWDGSNWLEIITNKECKKHYLKSLNKTIMPSNKYTYGLDTLYGFTCRDESFDFSTDYTEYLFFISKGIVMVKNESTFYKRRDYSSGATPTNGKLELTVIN